jgi:hypothetical protein
MYPNGSTSLTPTLNAIFSKLDTSSRWRVGSWDSNPVVQIYPSTKVQNDDLKTWNYINWSPNFRPVIVRMCLTYWRLRLRLELVMYFRLGTFIHRLSSTHWSSWGFDEHLLGMKHCPFGFVFNVSTLYQPNFNLQLIMSTGFVVTPTIQR